MTELELTQRSNSGHRDGQSYLHTSTQLVLVLLALLGIYLYAQFLFNPANGGDTVPWLLVLIAESFIMVQAIITLWTIVSGGYNPRDYHYYYTQERLFSPTGRSGITALHDDAARPISVANPRPFYIDQRRVKVDVYITVYGEPLGVIRRTAIAARDMTGLHETYILDDGKSDDVRRLAQQLGVKYLRRDDSRGAKAGNINRALERTDGDFFVIFDADFTPSELFLYQTLPFFADPHLAFVQAPQTYGNLGSAVSRGAGYQQQVFYKLIQPGKNRFNSAFCVGTNVVFRRAAIEQIGGIYEQSKSEDIWTSLKLHERGYKSIYLSDTLAVGDAPENIKAYSKQQLRWATGSMEILFHGNPLFKRGLSLWQRILYLETATFYLQGVAAALLMLLPPLQIFFGLVPINLSIAFGAWAFYYLSFYAMQIVVASHAMGRFRLETILLATASFPIYFKALWHGFWLKDKAWQATGATKFDSPYNYILPQLLIFLFLCFTDYVGVVKIIAQHNISLTLFWNFLNTFVFGGFILLAMREQRQLKHANRQHKRDQRRQNKARARHRQQIIVKAGR